MELDVDANLFLGVCDHRNSDPSADRNCSPRSSPGSSIESTSRRLLLIDSPEFSRILAALADADPHSDTSIEVLTNGDHFYEAELAAIEGRQPYLPGGVHLSEGRDRNALYRGADGAGACGSQGADGAGRGWQLQHVAEHLPRPDRGRRRGLLVHAPALVQPDAL